MGNCCCGNRTDGNTHPPPARTHSNSQVNPDLSSYEAACRLDPDLRTFDSALQERTSRVINSLATAVEVPSLSLDSLREVTGALLDMNEEVVNVILECQRDIWKNKDLSELVQDYFETSLKTLDFCTALERCLKRARDTQLILLVALQKFEDEQREGLNGEENPFSRTLQELSNFKSASDPFTDEFFSLFQSVYWRQMLMLEKLQAKKKKLDKKLKSVKDWRKVSNVIFGVTFAAVLICSVVAAAISAPPVVAAVAAAAAVPLGSMGKWLNSIWKKWENEIRGQRELIATMKMGTIIAIKDMDSIRVLVDRLEIEIESLLQTSDFALREKGTVRIAIDEIKKKVSVFMHSIEDLGQQSDKCSRRIRMARTVILQTILRQRSK